MVARQVSKEEIAAALKPGVIYLVKGTTQQIKCLLPETVRIEQHYNPTTTVFRQWLIPNLLDNQLVAKVIYYPQLTGTGRIKATKTTKRSIYGSVQNDSLYALPNDQTVQLPKNIYFFVLLTDPVTGEVNKVNAKNNLAGDYIEELDLRHVVFIEGGSKVDNELPLTAYKKAKTTDPLLLEVYEENAQEQETYSGFQKVNPYIKALLTIDGARIWYELGIKGDFYKFFLVSYASTKDTEHEVPVILKSARAWQLDPYLSMFLEPVRDNATLASTQLTKFANWVYLASMVYTEPQAPGLYWYEPVNKAKKGYWMFKPSREAKLQLPMFLGET